MRAVMAISALGGLRSHPGLKTGLRTRLRHSQPSRKSTHVKPIKKAGVTRRGQVNGNRNENGFGMDRDINGARGIFLRALGDSPFLHGLLTQVATQTTAVSSNVV